MSKHDNAWFNDGTGEIHTPKGRMVWPTLFEPRGIKNKPDSKPKFSVTLLIPKTANIDALVKNIQDQAQSKFGAKWKEKKLLLPLFKSVDEPKFAEYADDFPHFLRCSATPEYPPFIFGPNAQPFQGDHSEVYSGRWAIVAGSAYGYDNVQKGVNFGMNRIQLLDHDEAIAGGRVRTAAGFDAVEAVGGKPAAGGGTTDELWQ